MRMSQSIPVRQLGGGATAAGRAAPRIRVVEAITEDRSPSRRRARRPPRPPRCCDPRLENDAGLRSTSDNCSCPRTRCASLQMTTCGFTSCFPRALTFPDSVFPCTSGRNCLGSNCLETARACCPSRRENARTIARVMDIFGPKALIMRCARLHQRACEKRARVFRGVRGIGPRPGRRGSHRELSTGGSRLRADRGTVAARSVTIVSLKGGASAPHRRAADSLSALGRAFFSGKPYRYRAADRSRYIALVAPEARAPRAARRSPQVAPCA